MRSNIYETDKLVAEYLLFHYGTPDEVLPYRDGPHTALEYPARCVAECVDVARIPISARALDLGCAVGRSSFELARHCEEVVGVDFSSAFIGAASTLQSHGELPYLRADEGKLTTPLTARVPAEIARERVRFCVGDAMALPADLGSFNVVLLANLIDRLPDPERCLERLPQLVKPGGQLIVTSPYTWLEGFTPTARWLGGYERDGEPISTLGALSKRLDTAFELRETKDLPFLIREHVRKFQWSVAQASIWTRR